MKKMLLKRTRLQIEQQERDRVPPGARGLALCYSQTVSQLQWQCNPRTMAKSRVTRAFCPKHHFLDYCIAVRFPLGNAFWIGACKAKEVQKLNQCPLKSHLQTRSYTQ